MNILVTGGSGFIGTVLVSQLRSAGYDVRIFDKALSAAFPQLCVIGDVRDSSAVAEACRGVNLVIHLAAEHADDVMPRSLYYEVNVGGARNLVSACESANVKAILFTSSVAVYGLNAGVAKEENPISPFNDYGHSKWQAEEVFMSWQNADPDRRLTIIRPSVVFGERNRGNIFNLIEMIYRKRFIMVGRGGNRKSVAYVENIAGFLTSQAALTPGFQLFNYADSPDLSTAQLIGVVRRELGLPDSNFRLPLVVGLLAGHIFDLVSAVTGRRFPVSAVRIRKFNADTQVSAERAFGTGYVAPFSIADGLRRMIKCEFPVSG